MHLFPLVQSNISPYFSTIKHESSVLNFWKVYRNSQVQGQYQQWSTWTISHHPKPAGLSPSPRHTVRNRWSLRVFMLSLRFYSAQVCGMWHMLLKRNFGGFKCYITQSECALILIFVLGYLNRWSPYLLVCDLLHVMASLADVATCVNDSVLLFYYFHLSCGRFNCFQGGSLILQKCMLSSF